MTIGSTTVATSGSTGNGATTVFSFTFSVEAYGAVTQAAQIQVIKETIATGAESILTLTTDYTTSFNADQNASPGGSITMVSAPSSAYKIWIRLAPSFLQATDYQNQGGFLMETVEDQADQQARQINVLADRIRRAPRVGIQAGSSFDGEITGDVTPGYIPQVNSGGTGFTLVANNGSSSLVTATGGTTALTLAARYGRMLTPEDFGAVGDGVTDDATALAAWLACGDKYLQARGTYKHSVMLTIPADVCVDAMGASFTPIGNIDVIRLHGAAKLFGYPHIDVSAVAGWNSAALLFDGSSYAVAGNQFLLYRPTIAHVRLTGVTTGTGNGVGVYFKTVDDLVNNQWIQGVTVHAIGRGFDKALYMVKDGTDITRTFVNSNTIVMEWGSPYQTVVMESDHANGYSVDGNKIFFRVQSRASGEQNAVPLVLLGQYNEVEGIQWDWVGGGGGTTNVLTLAANARGNRIKGPFDPALVVNSSTETNNSIDNTYLSGSGAFFVGDLRAIVSSGFIQFGSSVRPIANDGAALGTGALSFSDLFLASGGVVNFNNGDVTLTHSADLLTGAGGQLFWAQGAASTSPTGKFTNTTDAATVIALSVEGDRATPAANDAVAIEFKLSDSAGNQDGMGRVMCLATDVTNASEDAQFRFTIMVAGVLVPTLDITSAFLRPVTNDLLALGSASISFSDLFLASGAIINFNNGNVTLTHSANALAFAGVTSGVSFDGFVRSSHATTPIGYATGAGGTVTQATSKSTGVTLNKNTGQITMNGAALAAATSVSFTLTNSAIAATDVVAVNIGSVASADSYAVTVDAVAAGTCRIQVRNISVGSLSEALVLNFVVFKGATA